MEVADVLHLMLRVSDQVWWFPKPLTSGKDALRNRTISTLGSMGSYPQQIDKEEPSQLIQAGWALQRSLENLKYQKPDSSGFDYGI